MAEVLCVRAARTSTWSSRSPSNVLGGSPHLVSGDRITPIYVSHEVRPFGRGPKQPYLGDLRSPWLLTTS